MLLPESFLCLCLFFFGGHVTFIILRIFDLERPDFFDVEIQIVLLIKEIVWSFGIHYGLRATIGTRFLVRLLLVEIWFVDGITLGILLVHFFIGHALLCVIYMFYFI